MLTTHHNNKQQYIPSFLVLLLLFTMHSTNFSFLIKYITPTYYPLLSLLKTCTTLKSSCVPCAMSNKFAIKKCKFQYLPLTLSLWHYAYQSCCLSIPTFKIKVLCPQSFFRSKHMVAIWWHQSCAINISTNTNVVAIIIAHMLEHNLYYGPNHNYNKGAKFGSLAAAKYHLQLGRLMGTVFTIDYDKVLENAAKLQLQIASTQDWCNFIITDGVIHNLHFTCKVFEQHVHIPFTPPFFLYLIFCF